MVTPTDSNCENGQRLSTPTGVWLPTSTFAYVQWAGITAGKAPSFFSFFGGGEGWANIFSPDRQGYNQPDLFAYTATFGGGFSATIAAESCCQSSTSPGNGGNTGTYANVDTTNYGITAPDVVGVLRVDQGWGSAQVSGVAHQVHVYDTALGANGVGADGLSDSVNKWGWGIGAGISFNLPMLGAADKLALQGDYTQNAFWYSGIPDGMWGENGAVNGNGLAMTAGDNFITLPASTPQASAIAGLVDADNLVDRRHLRASLLADFLSSIRRPPTLTSTGAIPLGSFRRIRAAGSLAASRIGIPCRFSISPSS